MPYEVDWYVIFHILESSLSVSMGEQNSEVLQVQKPALPDGKFEVCKVGYVDCPPGSDAQVRCNHNEIMNTALMFDLCPYPSIQWR